MTINEYLENLYRLKNLSVNRWGELGPMERDVIDGSFEWLIDKLEIKSGEVQVNEDLSRSMDEFVKAVVDIIGNNKSFGSKLTGFLSDLTNIQKNNKAFHQTTNKFNINTAGVNHVQKAVIEEIIDQYTGNGLNAHFAQPLRDNIFRNILTGANMRQVKEVLRLHILSGQDESGKLGQYLTQTAQQAVDTYTGAINQQLVKEFTFTGYIISGSLIETSSKQCIYAVENSQRGYFSFAEWEKILDMARNNPKAKLIEGTTIKTLPINKLHWGCRHDFTPIIKAEPKKEPPKEEPPKPPIEPKKDPPKPPPAKPKKEKGTPGMLTNSQVRERVPEIFKKNLGLNVSRVTISSELPNGLLNRMVQTVNDLTSEYNISPTVQKDVPFKVSFRSSKRNHGYVKTRFDGSRFIEINFGHTSDTNRAVVSSEKIGFLRPKATVDKENEEISTVVHEFGHVISTQRQANDMYNNHVGFENFWLDMMQIKKDYHAEVNSIFQKNNHDAELAEVYLGQYASTNLNEFMAEAFTEYRLRKKPSKYAKKVGILIDKFFKK